MTVTMSPTQSSLPSKRRRIRKRVRSEKARNIRLTWVSAFLIIFAQAIIGATKVRSQPSANAPFFLAGGVPFKPRAAHRSAPNKIAHPFYERDALIQSNAGLRLCSLLSCESIQNLVGSHREPLPIAVGPVRHQLDHYIRLGEYGYYSSF
jgi:hypothetical protein